MAGNPALTKLLIVGLLITFVTATLLSNYVSFAYINGVTVEEPYKTAFETIGAQYAGLEGIGNTVKDRNLVTTILNFGSSAITGTVNVFITGLNAIGTFFEMVPIYGNILQAISFGIPGLSGLINMMIIIVGIYVAMKYIQSASNKQDLP